MSPVERVGPRTPAGVWSLAWSPDAASLAAVGSDPQIRMRDADGTVRALPTGHTAQVNAVAWSPDGTSIATASDDHTAGLCDPASGARLVTLSGHSARVNDIGWAHDGSRLATAGADTTVVIWNAATASPVGALRGHRGRVICVDWAPDDRRLISTGDDGTAIVWDVPELRTVTTLTGHIGRVLSAAWAPDATLLATLADDGWALVWDPGSESAVARLSVSAEFGWADSLCWSPDGRWLAAACDDGAAVLWDPRNNSVVTRLREAGAALTSLAWSADGASLATGDVTGAVRIWDVQRGVPRAHFNVGGAAPAARTRRVFLSYAAADPVANAMVRELTDRLRHWGVDLWISTGQISPGDEWESALRQGIDDSDAAILIVTAEYLVSKATELERELLFSRSQRKPGPAFPILPLVAADLHVEQYKDAPGGKQLAALQGLTVDPDPRKVGDTEGLRSWIRNPVVRSQPSTVERESAAPSPHPTAPDDARSAARLGARAGLLDALATDIRVNPLAQGQALLVLPDGPPPSYSLPGDGTVTLLSPDADALRQVSNAWQATLENAGLPAPGGARRPDADATTATEPSAAESRSAQADDFGRDRSVANGASLAFLVEYAGTSCLIAGDAHAARLEQSVRQLLRQRGRERLRVDVMVLPHNGSRRNITPALLSMLDCDRFVVSTNGALFNHPDESAITLLGKDRTSAPTVYFNYRSASTERYADPEVQRRLNIVTVFPERGRPTTIAVPPPDLLA